jgi:hypothetical protein
MFEAQLLMKGSVVFGPWFPRRGDNIRATLDVVNILGTNTKIVVELYTKNTETPGNGENADTSGTPRLNIEGTARDQTTTEWSEDTDSDVQILELVRYKYTVTSEDDFGWVLFRMLAPVWFDSVEI